MGVKVNASTTKSDPYAEVVCYYNDYINEEHWYEGDDGHMFYYPALALEIVANSVKYVIFPSSPFFMNC